MWCHQGRNAEDGDLDSATVVLSLCVLKARMQCDVLLRRQFEVDLHSGDRLIA